MLAAISHVRGYNSIVMSTLTEIDVLLHDFIYNGYQALSHYLTVPLGLIATLYMVILGYAVMMGWVHVSINQFVKAVLKIGFIYMAVTQWNFVCKYFVDLINHTIGKLGDVLISATPAHIPGVDSIDGAMQIVLTQFAQLASKIFDNGSLINIAAWIDGLILWAFGYGMVGLSLLEITLSKVMLSILFIFTPLIVLFCYFKSLQGIFNRWIGAIVGFALLQVFVITALTLSLSLAYWWIEALAGESALKIGNYGTLPAILIGIICVGLVLKAASLAQNLGGMISTSEASHMVGSLFGKALSGLVSTLHFKHSTPSSQTANKKAQSNSTSPYPSTEDKAQSVINDVRLSLTYIEQNPGHSEKNDD